MPQGRLQGPGVGASDRTHAGQNRFKTVYKPAGGRRVQCVAAKSCRLGSMARFERRVMHFCHAVDDGDIATIRHRGGSRSSARRVFPRARSRRPLRTLIRNVVVVASRRARCAPNVCTAAKPPDECRDSNQRRIVFPRCQQQHPARAILRDPAR